MKHRFVILGATENPNFFCILYYMPKYIATKSFSTGIISRIAPARTTYSHI